ncbi:MAG TPA: hypothetical protein VL326_31785, partial [Kofleriaceae bacterium]|nr:hypothetical protein [Kofleriaceae bacterium]
SFRPTPVNVIGLSCPIPACGTTALLTDNFDDTVPGPSFTKGADTGLTVTESSGHVDVTFAASVAANAYGWYASSATYTANGLCTAIEVSQIPSNGGAAYFKLASGTTEIEFFESSGTLSLRYKNPTLVTQKTVPMDLAAHRFWRIRQQGGTTYWDTSPDGINYLEQVSTANVFTPTTGTITFGAGTFTSVVNGGNARFESVNAKGP